MKSRKKVLLGIVSFTASCVMAASACACGYTGNGKTEAGKNTAADDSHEILMLNSDYTFSQEQQLSRIKAENLKKNEGYLDGDDVVVVLTLDDDSLIDTYNANPNGFSSPDGYALSRRGAMQSGRLLSEQNALAASLKAQGLISGVEYNYTVITNAMAVRTKYGKISALGAQAGVSSVSLSETYNRPQSASTDASVIINDVDVYETGIFNSGAVDYTGKGTSVAVLDSGFDCSHPVFNTHEIENPSIGREKVEEFLNKKDDAGAYMSNASKTTENLKLYNVYYSSKIPYHYDYADKDYDVFPYDSEHGTHVAGIIGGQAASYPDKDGNTVVDSTGADIPFRGVAIDTQLVCMKVFPDLDDGGRTEDILAALEDAVLLGVDAINMSLGSSCGFSREADEEHLNAVYDSINASGISLITAASNSYSSAYGGENGNTNKTTNPDSGTVGSPSTYGAALSVASISGVKSTYIVANDEKVFFYKESSQLNGKENDFLQELINSGALEEGEEKTFEYVTVPGTGGKVSYNNVNVKGKIALVRRGDNTFEEKALLAKKAGAIACIIYNNVEGEILMSMGKTDHVPTVSISKEDGTALAARASGTMKLSSKYKAGPFMSDFSSWGPTPSLELKPEITAHGGNIRSAVPNNGYDDLSGTSMATPNLCGIVLLIRHYIKDSYPNKTWKEVSVMTNELLMSTANIVLNEQGNPYSPRKQGAGLASLKNVVDTKAYLTVDGKDRSKLELKDDPDRTGVYTMEFNVVNLSSETLEYDLSVAGMTESVSFSDKDYVAEKPQMLSGDFTLQVLSGGSAAGKRVRVDANATAKVKVVYTLTQEDKALIDRLFRYGMYVEGFVKLASETEVDLSIPFLAFYGDWTEAPLFDKTYYEVESEAHDGSIDEEDKLKADYYATTPYGSYFYNYMIPLGTYLYTIDETRYDPIPASLDKIAISDTLGTIDGISSVYTGLLRCAKQMNYTVTDKLTGEKLWKLTEYDCMKAHFNNNVQFPYFESLKLSSRKLGLINNRQYEFKMEGLLDYGEDGGADTNIRNTFEFDFYFDTEAPVIKNATYEKVYDRTLKKNRYYLNMTVYDNQYAMSVTPIIFTSTSSYTYLTENPIPLYGERGSDTKVRIEITDFLDEIYADEIITSALAFSVDDYALNSNLYLCQLPGTKGDFKFTYTGMPDGTKMDSIGMKTGEILDLTRYLSTADSETDADKDFLKHLSWTSSDESVARVRDGQVYGLKAGLVKITAEEQLNGSRASVIVRVKEPEASTAVLNTKNERKATTYASDGVVDNIDDASLESVKFTYFDTLFAYSRAAQTSEIGKTGSRMFLTDVNEISLYPGEKIKLAYRVFPWYVEDKYTFSFSSFNKNIATVDEDGTVTALSEGSVYVTLKVEGSNIMARIKITVKNPFIIEGRVLTAYKGLGGKVVIPDDEGILYIGAYAFCLYTTDESIELTEDDYDANKIPSKNTSITEVVIPDGVEDIQKYAFYNCQNLKKVTIPASVKYIRDFAFYEDKELNSFELPEKSKLEVIGRMAFGKCTALTSFDLSNIYALGEGAFYESGLTSANLSALRNTANGKIYTVDDNSAEDEYMYTGAFSGCKDLISVTMNENTKLAEYMFMGSGIREVDIYCKDTDIPAYCFARCSNLERVTIHNDVEAIAYGAFRECEKLTSVTFPAVVKEIEEQAFMNDTALVEITLPSSEITLGNASFYGCEKLAKINLSANTVFKKLDGAIFEGTAITGFNADASGQYSVDGNYLMSKDGTTLYFAFTGSDFAALTIPATVTKINDSAFCGAKITSVTITNPNTEIGAYAFADCEKLKTVILLNASGVKIGAHAFHGSGVAEVQNLASAVLVGDNAFTGSKLKTAHIGAGAVYGERAFSSCKELTSIEIGAGATLGKEAFRGCKKLETVTMPAANVMLSEGCFAQDTALKTIDLSHITGKLPDQIFFGCTALTEAALSEITEVGAYAFADCAKLTTVSFPKVEKIGEGAFSRNTVSGSAPSLRALPFPETLNSIGLGAFLGCGGFTVVTLPEGITELQDYTFSYCGSLVNVTLPEGLKKIGKYAFAGCAMLRSVNLDHTEEIGERAFYNCEALGGADLSSAKRIEDEAFLNCAIVSNITADALTHIGKSAFGANGITSFTAKNLEHIGDGAFEGNYMTVFAFSSKVSYVGARAFKDCSLLSQFTATNVEAVSGKINDYAFLENGMLYTYLAEGRFELNAIPAAKNISALTVLEGTHRIGEYAANANRNLTKVVLPDSLKTVGGYAFYGCSKLKTVEFRSVTAPILENTYNEKTELAETDYGYGKLHKYFDFFGLELCYYNFVDLLGKFEPIKMILPQNDDISGYDSLVYEVYFGSVKDAERSDYVAAQQSLSEFYEYAKALEQVETITLEHETLIDNALSAYQSVTQNPADYGYNEEEFKALAALVKRAKEEVVLKKILAYGTEQTYAIQQKIFALDTNFKPDGLSALKELSDEISALKVSERQLLYLANYNALVQSYNAYVSALDAEIAPVVSSMKGFGANVGEEAAALMAFTALAVVSKQSALY